MRPQAIPQRRFHPQVAKGETSILWVRRLTFTIMIFMVLEGAFRKWIFPSQQALIYLIKDGLLLLTLFVFVPRYRAQNWRVPLPPAVRLALALSLGYFLLEVVNPFSPSILVGMVGYKNYLLYASLFCLVPFVFNNEDDFEDKIGTYMLLMIPICILGFVQFASPTNSWINTYVQHDADAEMSIASFGSGAASARVRATGTFSYIGGFGAFVGAMYMLSLACILGGGRSPRFNKAAYLLFAASALAVFTTGSRGVFVSTFLSTPIVLLLCLSSGVVTARLVLRLCAGLLLVSLVNFLIASDAVDAFMHRANNADSNWVRFFSPITDWAGAVADTPAIGIGIGSTHASAASIMQVKGFFDYWWLRGMFYEGEAARVVIETGVIGFILSYIPRMAVIFIAIKMMRRLQSPLFKALSASIATLSFGLLFGSIISNPTAGLYFWFSAGLLFAMYRIENLRRVEDHPRVVRRYAGLRTN